MAYTAFADNKPVASDNGLTVVDETRNNLMALRDAVVMGAASGWDYSPSGGTAEEPATVTFSKSTERIRGTLTWTSGNVTVAVWEYSSNGGVAYDAIGTETIGYDVDSNVISVTWS